MSDSTNPPANDSSTAAEAAPPKPPLPAFLDPENAPLPKSGWLRRWPWVTVLMPFLVYMLFQLMFESRLADPPKPKADSAQTEAEKPAGEENIAEAKMREDRERKEHEEQAGKIPYDQYPKWYTVKIVATTIAILLVIPGYMYFPWRVHGLAWVVGIVGAVVWVVLAKLQVATYPMLPEMVSKALELGGRPGFNPLEQLKDDPTWMWEFLAIRFFGLVIVVPIIEEFFIRGFLMRYVMDVDWPLIPFGVVNQLAIAAGIGFPVLSHPERLAAIAWFSMVTWLMVRTKSIGDCIVAHALTNLLLGLYVVWFNEWWLM